MKRLIPSAALVAIWAICVIQSPAAAQFSVGTTVNFAPPALPIYDQPPIPAPDYIWVPGYWAWDGYVQDYFWVPGTWLQAPRPGLLWTPAWWGWQGGAYIFHEGFWGPHVGFYGGVPYGFGYTGSGYQGAYWNGGHVYYNRSVTNITNVHVTNVYNKTVIVNRVTNVSYNGGPVGIQARPSSFEQVAMREPHIAQTPVQQQHFQAAHANRQLFASTNHGRPAIAATVRPAVLSGSGVVPTRQAVVYHPQGGDPRPGGSTPGQPQPMARPRSMPQDNGADPGQSARIEQQQPIQAPARKSRSANDGGRDEGAPFHGYPDAQPMPSSRPDVNGQDNNRPRDATRRDVAPSREGMSPPSGTSHAPATPPPRPASAPHPRPHPQEGHPKPPPEHHDDHHG